MPAPSHTTDTKQNQKNPTRSVEGTRQNGEATPTFGAQHSLLSLHRTIGNRAFGQVLQAKLAISSPGDAYEQEADRVADQVMAKSVHSAVRGAPPCIQRYIGQATEGADTAPASVDRVLASSGIPLEPALRQDMEQRFGHDFSRVRVHSGADAEQSARDVSANAYTVGHNVVFGKERYAPDSNEGKWLVAHELAHVVQQSRGGAAPPLEHHGQHERSAAGTAAQVATGTAPIVVQCAAGIGVARNTQLSGEEDPLPGAFNDSPVTTATGKLPALTPDELMERLVLIERGFRASPGGTPINTPKGKGSTLGPGYNTYAGVQIIDKEGNQVISTIGRYTGGGKAHAEADAVRHLWAAVQKSGVNVNGMRMMVVVDQTACESCTIALETFAQDSGITKMDVYLTSREGVTPKTAARTAAKVGAKAKPSFTKKFPSKPVSANISPGQRRVPLGSEGALKVRISSDEAGKISEQNTAKPPVGKGGGVNSNEPRVRIGEQSPASNPSSPQVKLRVVDGRLVNTESIVGVLGAEENPTSGNLEKAKPAAKQAATPLPTRTPPAAPAAPGASTTATAGKPPAMPVPRVPSTPPKPESPNLKTPPRAKSPTSTKNISEENAKNAQRAQGLGALASVAGAYAKSGAENFSADKARWEALKDFEKARDEIFEDLWNSPGQGMNISFLFLSVTPKNGQPASLVYLGMGQLKTNSQRTTGGYIVYSKEKEAEKRELEAAPSLTVEEIPRSIWVKPVRTVAEGNAIEKPKGSETTPTFIGSFNAFIENTVSLAKNNLFHYELSAYESLKQSSSTMTGHLASFDGFKFQIPHPVYDQLLTYFDTRVHDQLTKTLDGLNRKMEFYAGRLTERREEGLISKVINSRGDIPLDPAMFNLPGSHLAAAAGRIRKSAYRHAKESLEQAEALLNEKEAWLFRYDKGYFPAWHDSIQ